MKKLYSHFLFEKRITKNPFLVKINLRENSKNKSLSYINSSEKHEGLICVIESKFINK